MGGIFHCNHLIGQWVLEEPNPGEEEVRCKASNRDGAGRKCSLRPPIIQKPKIIEDPNIVAPSEHSMHSLMYMYSSVKITQQCTHIKHNTIQNCTVDSGTKRGTQTIVVHTTTSQSHYIADTHKDKTVSTQQYACNTSYRVQYEHSYQQSFRYDITHTITGIFTIWRCIKLALWKCIVSITTDTVNKIDIVEMRETTKPLRVAVKTTKI